MRTRGELVAEKIENIVSAIGMINTIAMISASLISTT